MRRVREPFPASAPALAAAAAAAADAGHVEAVREAVRYGRTRLAQSLTDLGLRPHPGQGNFVWAQTRQGGTALTAALRRAGVLIRDGTGFGVPDHVRITVGTPEETGILLAAARRVLGELEAP